VARADTGAKSSRPKFPVANSRLVFADDGGLAGGWTRLNTGDPCAPWRELSSLDLGGDFSIDPACSELPTVAAEDMRGRPILRGIVYLWALDTPPAELLEVDRLSGDAERACGGALHLIQSLATDPLPQPPALWFVTRGAQPVGGLLPGVIQSPLLGLVKAAALEHPALRCLRVDLDPDDAERAPQVLFDEIHSNSLEDQVAVRGRAVCRPADTSSSSLQRRVAPAAAGGYLITGGLRGLDCWLLAGWWSGARRLVFVGRSGPVPKRKSNWLS
jgi:hypothetical protein